MENNISGNDINRMKREAIKRAHIANEQNNKKISKNSPASEQQTQNNTNSDPVKINSTAQKNISNTIFSSLGKDPEEILIFVLIIILADENVDIELIFALIYLLI